MNRLLLLTLALGAALAGAQAAAPFSFPTIVLPAEESPTLQLQGQKEVVLGGVTSSSSATTTTMSTFASFGTYVTDDRELLGMVRVMGNSRPSLTNVFLGGGYDYHWITGESRGVPHAALLAGMRFDDGASPSLALAVQGGYKYYFLYDRMSVMLNITYVTGNATASTSLDAGLGVNY